MQKIKIKPRHELKYFISQGEAMILGGVLDEVMWRDSYADENREYHIRSLYFDDYDNSAYYDKISGVYRRDKYRIRLYNHDDTRIKLECKSKYGDLIAKRSADISRETAERIMRGDVRGLEKADDQLLGDFFIAVKTKLLRPVVIVDYVREAFLLPVENTRITLDKVLRSGGDSIDIFNKNLPTYNPLDTISVILEVKYDLILAQHLREIIKNTPSQRQAISKYTLCRAAQF